MIQMKNRDDVLDGALVQFNADPTSSMAQIAEAVGISRATLNRHFTSRDALVRELGLRSVDRWEQSQSGIEAAGLSGDPEAIAAALDAMIRAFVIDAQDYGFTLTDHVIAVMPDLVSRTEALMDREVAFYTAAQEAGVLRRDLPARWIENLMLGLMVASRESLRRGDIARRDVAVSTFLAGTGASQR
jgi:AcrR family transcriptional regulator